MNGDECRDHFASQRVARLATVGPAGPRIVPITFAFDGGNIVSAIDDKPKTTTRLRRLTDIANNPRVAVLADHYDEDWSQLWWVRADGIAQMVEHGEAMERAIDRLAERYPQYRESRPRGPVISVSVTQWSGWSAAET